MDQNRSVYQISSQIRKDWDLYFEHRYRWADKSWIEKRTSLGNSSIKYHAYVIVFNLLTFQKKKRFLWEVVEKVSVDLESKHVSIPNFIKISQKWWPVGWVQENNTDRRTDKLESIQNYFWYNKSCVWVLQPSAQT